MSDPRLDEMIRLARLLVERDGQRLYSYQNSPAIIRIEPEGNYSMWIKRWGLRFTITLSYKLENARSCIYDNGPFGKDPLFAPTWVPIYEPFLEELRRRMVLDILAQCDAAYR